MGVQFGDFVELRKIALKALKLGGESYDAVIRRLMKMPAAG